MLVSFSEVGRNYPSRAIRIVVAFPAGGGSDLAARVVAQKLSEGSVSGGRRKPRRANGSVGAEAVARPPRRLYARLWQHANITTNPHLMALPTIR